MSDPRLPDEGAVLVVSSAEQAGRWGDVVADRNSSGHRTALLVAESGPAEVDQEATAMAAEVFMGAPYLVVQTDGGA